MSVLMNATVWSEDGEEKHKIECDTGFGHINLTQGDQDISIVDEEHARSLLLAIGAMAHTMGWDVK